MPHGVSSRKQVSQSSSSPVPPVVAEPPTGVNVLPRASFRRSVVCLRKYVHIGDTCGRSWVLLNAKIPASSAFLAVPFLGSNERRTRKSSLCPGRSVVVNVTRTYAGSQQDRETIYERSPSFHVTWANIIDGISISFFGGVDPALDTASGRNGLYRRRGVVECTETIRSARTRRGSVAMNNSLD